MIIAVRSKVEAVLLEPTTLLTNKPQVAQTVAVDAVVRVVHPRLAQQLHHQRRAQRRDRGAGFADSCRQERRNGVCTAGRQEGEPDGLESLLTVSSTLERVPCPNLGLVNQTARRKAATEQL